MSRSGARAEAEPGVPGLADPAVRWLLLFVLLLQVLSWRMLEGYQLADSVEYMERALTFVRGEEMIDSQAIRSFGFSSVLVPFFGLWELLGIEDFRPLVPIFRGLQVVLGLGLVHRCVRLGARLGGRGAGLAAGFVCGVNPIFLQYTVSPLSGVAAALFVALALEALFERGTWRRALVGGLWLGLAFLMAFQSILIIAPIALVVFARDRFRHFRTTGGIAVGVGVAVLAQLVLDKIIYDAWGASLKRYMIENGLYTFVRMIYDAGRVTGIQALEGAARTIYEWANELQGREFDAEAAEQGPRQMQHRWWYLLHLSNMLVWPILAFAAAGLLRAWRHMSWRSTLLVAVLIANVVVMSFKGSKSYRLWLPLLPMIAPLCGWGWAWLAGAARRDAGAWRKVVTAAMLAAGAVLGVQALLGLNTRRFGVYWEAMAIINAQVDDGWEEFAAKWKPRERLPWEEPDSVERHPTVRVSSAYHWAMYLRESPRVNLVKLPHHLDSWAAYDEEKRGKDVEVIRSLDWFVTHLPVLTQHPDLFDVVNRHFEVHAALYHDEVFQGLGPVFLLKRRTGDPAAKTFFDVFPGLEALPERDALLGVRTLFAGNGPDGAPARAELLGFDYDELPGRGYGWISYYWRTDTKLERDYTLVDRVTGPDESRVWQNNHGGAYGVHPTSKWRPGEVLRESYLLVPSHEPYAPGSLKNYIGGGFRRGDLIPVRLWFELIDLEAADPEATRLAPAVPALRARASGGLVHVGGFLMPVHPDARAPDDGRPLD